MRHYTSIAYVKLIKIFLMIYRFLVFYYIQTYFILYTHSKEGIIALYAIYNIYIETIYYMVYNNMYIFIYIIILYVYKIKHVKSHT